LVVVDGATLAIPRFGGLAIPLFGSVAAVVRRALFVWDVVLADARVASKATRPHNIISTSTMASTRHDRFRGRGWTGALNLAGGIVTFVLRVPSP